MSTPGKWDERFGVEEYIYGLEPNRFFREFIDSHEPGRLLLPAEGEGRHAVYAATKGWDVTAFDFSKVAGKKAIKLASDAGVSIQYHICSLEAFGDAGKPSTGTKCTFQESSFDAVALLSVHMDPELRKKVHKRAIRCLKPGGYVVLEAFSKKQADERTGEQANGRVGGPKDVNLLYSKEELASDFADLDIIELEEFQQDFKAGIMHSGPEKEFGFWGSE